MKTDMQESTLPPTPQKSLTPIFIGAALVIAAVGGGLFWRMNGTKLAASGTGNTNGPGGEYGAALGASNAHAENAKGGDPQAAHTVKQAGAAGNELDGIQVPDLALMHAVPPPPDESELEPESTVKNSGLSNMPETNPKSPKSNLAPGCAGPCSGPSASMTSALRRRAGAARGCYQSGLRQNSMLSGKMTVGIRIAPNGKACWAKPVSNSLGDPSVTSCILQKFRAAGYPRPSSCVEANVPLNFVSK